MTRGVQSPAPAVCQLTFTDSIRADIATCTLFAMLCFVVLAPLLTVAPSNTYTDAAGAGNLARQIVYTLIFALALVSAQVFEHPIRIWSPPAGILAMLAWCCLSMLWAADRDVGVRRLLLMVIVVFSVFLLVRRAGYAKTVAAVRYLLPLVLVANYLAVIAVPGWAIHQAATELDQSVAGAWRGILMDKNFAGPACAYTIIFFTFDAKSIQSAVRFAVILLAAFFLYHTQSKSSAGFLIASVGLGALFTKYNPHHRAIATAVLIMGACLMAFWTYLNWGLLAAPFSQPDFLTGRVQIWPILIDYWKDHWLLGSGYGSFWNVHNPQPIYQYTKSWVSGIASGHNGYLDLLVQTGVPGLVLAVGATVVAPMRSFINDLSLGRSRGSLLLACISFAIFHNLTESSIFNTDAMVNVFLMMGIALLALEAGVNRHQSNDIGRFRDRWQQASRTWR